MVADPPPAAGPAGAGGWAGCVAAPAAGVRSVLAAASCGLPPPQPISTNTETTNVVIRVEYITTSFWSITVFCAALAAATRRPPTATPRARRGCYHPTPPPPPIQGPPGPRPQRRQDWRGDSRAARRAAIARRDRTPHSPTPRTCRAAR